MKENPTFIIDSVKAMEITSKSYLKPLLFSSGVHTCDIYEIKPNAPLNEFTKCFHCEDHGIVLIHDKDHTNENTIFSACREHSSQHVLNTIDQRNSG